MAAGGGCKVCGHKFRLFSHKKKLCRRCGEQCCARCMVKSPRDVIRMVKDVKKSMCCGCNALIIVPFLSDLALTAAPAPQLARYLDQHDVDHSAAASHSDLETMVLATRRSRGRPDRETIGGPRAAAPLAAGGAAAAAAPGRASRLSSRRSARGGRGGRRSTHGSRRGGGGQPPAGDNRPSLANLLLAEHLLGQLLTTMGPELGDGGGGDGGADEQQRKREMRAQHEAEMKRQRITAKLQTAKSDAEFRAMRVADLKVILDENGVDHSTTLEKVELVRAVVELWETTQAMESAAPKERSCKICFDSAANCVFLECGHLVTCVTCGEKLDECPMCRKAIVRCVRVYET